MERAQARRKVKAEWDKLRMLRKEWDALNDSTRATATALVNASLEMEHLSVPSRSLEIIFSLV
ncbi:hypothetical protein T484DRAFT_1791482 [Baffinella frigidus]|nr:hypothetical protein T484DRAFT_1791482 [Cryptophyta sp. CCMP2293]